MSAIPGHNIVLQQSGVAQELTHQSQSLKPSPEQVIAQQQINEVAAGTTVQEFDESGKLKAKKKKQAARQRRKLRLKKTEKKPKQHKEPDYGAPGRLLDTKI
jgi:hypothetical protein